MNCPNCDTTNRPGAKFCNECASPLPLSCPSCGTMNRPGAKFCDECATSLTGQTVSPAPAQESPQPIPQSGSPTEIPPPAEPQVPEAERRQLTVMFCDLVGSTQLSGQLDPEELRDVIRAYQAACNNVIQRFEGYVAQHLGDGLLIYLGYPAAHEDDAERAVRTGLGIIEAMQTLNQRLAPSHGVELAVRIGIHTGLVVIGDIGAGERQEQLALGEPPNIAARIQGLAEPNTVVISDATHRLVEGYFECDTLGERALRGVDDPVTVYCVWRESDVQGRLDIARTRGLTPLVGREQEAGLLLQRWGQVTSGQGQVVLLSGEAGIGKSRLIQVLREQIGHEPHTRLECRSSPYYANTALYPVIDLLYRTLRMQATDGPEERLQKLETALEQYRLPLEEAVPLLATLLAIPIPEGRYEALHLTSQLQRQRTLETLLAILLELADQQPLLFILEDLHWTDPTTLELLGLIIDQVPTASILLLVTSRPEFSVPWGSRSYLTQVPLNRLSSRQIGQMAVEAAGRKNLPVEVVERLVQQTDGVPLFVEEMTKAIVEAGALKDVDGQYELTGSLTSLAIPSSLQDSLMARLDRLASAKSVAQYAAVIGRQFSYALLKAISPLDEMTLQRELGKLVAAELVFQRGVPPQATYTFKHALIQDAANQSLLHRTRQHYHQQIVRVLHEDFPEISETQPELLGHHCGAAGYDELALQYWRCAGEQAHQSSAFREEVRCLEQAIQIVEQLPERRTRIEQAVDLRFELRNPLLSLGDYPRILQILREAKSLAETLDDPSRLGRSYDHMSSILNLMGDHAHALAYAEQALTLAATSGDEELQVLARQHASMCNFALGNYRDAIDGFRQNKRWLSGDRLQARLGMNTPASITTRLCLVWCLTEVGQFSEAILIGKESIKLAEAANNLFALAYQYYGLGTTYLNQGHLPAAIQLLEQSLHLCQQADLERYAIVFGTFLSYAYALAGQLDPALALLDRATITDQPVGYRPALVMARRAEVALLAERREEAVLLAECSLQLSCDGHERGNQAWGLRLRGDIAFHDSAREQGQIEADYHQALALSRELGMRPLQAHCHRGLGKLYVQTGRTEPARDELSTAIGMYRDMEMTFWLPETEKALAEVEGR